MPTDTTMFLFVIGTISNYEVTGISRRMVKRHSLSNFAFPIVSPCPGGRCRFTAPWLPNKFADENGKKDYRYIPYIYDIKHYTKRDKYTKYS